MEAEDRYFTLVFKGDIKRFDFNPLTTVTVFERRLPSPSETRFLTVEALLSRAEAEE